MSLTTIINPLKSDEALLFYSNDNQNLALEHRALSGATPQEYTDNSFKGSIAVPGDLSAVVYANQITVYGIAKYTDTAGKPQQILATLSPFFNPVQSITSVSAASVNPGTYWSLAATSDGRTHSYVYYLQNPTGSLQPELLELTLTEQLPTTTVVGNTQPTTQSRLAAAWDPVRKTRLVFYQDRSLKAIAWANLITKNASPIKGTAGAPPGTPLAATTYPSGKDGQFCIYLYFRDSAGALNVIVHGPGDSDWQDVTPLNDAPVINPTSGLSVVANPAENCNVLHYIPDDGSTTFQIYKHILAK